jgi:hypothetical protein
MKSLIIILLFSFSCIEIYAQKAGKNKLSTKVVKETSVTNGFEMTIDERPYEAYLKDFVQSHKLFSAWKKEIEDKDVCKNEPKFKQADVYILVTVSHKGELSFEDHYSACEAQMSTSFVDFIEIVVKDLRKDIRNKNVLIKPAYNNSQERYVTDEKVVDIAWKACN